MRRFAAGAAEARSAARLKNASQPPAKRTRKKKTTKICEHLIILVPLILAVVGAAAEPAALTLQTPSWCKVPRLGEAKRPGPLSRLDDPEPEDDGFVDEVSEMEWDDDFCELAAACLPPDPDTPDSPEQAEPAAAGAVPAQLKPRPVHQPEFKASLSGAEAWLCKHAHSSFVPVRCKKPSQSSKFEGERPGWVFKLGGTGLGYYRDVGVRAYGAAACCRRTRREHGTSQDDP